MNVYAVLAAGVVLVHLVFVLFAVGGGLLALRWPHIAWIHLPAAAWAALIEFSGGICPLTPLENAMRERAGLEAYAGDFVATYIFPFLYPEGLTRQSQIVMGVAVTAVNAIAYLIVLQRGRRTKKKPLHD